MNEQRQPSEEELRAAVEEQLRQLRVEDVVYQTAGTLLNLAARRLSLPPGTEGERDLEQAKMAIEAVRSLTRVLPEDRQPPIREALSQLQVAFAREAQKMPGGEAAADAAAGAGAGAGGGTGEPGTGEPAPGEPGLSEEERARARAKIWTPGDEGRR